MAIRKIYRPKEVDELFGWSPSTRKRKVEPRWQFPARRRWIVKPSWQRRI